MYDRLFKKDLFTKIKPAFQKGWLDNFVSPDGNVVVFLSSLLGIVLEGGGPGILGSLFILCQEFLPDHAKQMYAMMKKESVKRGEKGELMGLNLASADTIDAGNYSSHPSALMSKAWSVRCCKPSSPV